MSAPTPSPHRSGDSHVHCRSAPRLGCRHGPSLACPGRGPPKGALAGSASDPRTPARPRPARSPALPGARRRCRGPDRLRW
eukprot:922665-Pyramimonas_sp.AAC.1